MSVASVYENLYRIERLAAAELSDGGGPFGFDAHTALAFDWLIERYGCDAIIETGCNHGDTTEYLARTYPHLTVLTCDVVPRYVEFVRERVGVLPNVAVDLCDSTELVRRVQGLFERPIYYLDAHWYEDWPLARELELIERGVIMIDDFDIGHPRFGYDEYKGVRCGPEILKPFAEKFPTFYVTNPNARYDLPCLQVGRRAGRAFCQVGLPRDYMRYHRWFARRDTATGAGPAKAAAAPGAAASSSE